MWCKELPKFCAGFVHNVMEQARCFGLFFGPLCFVWLCYTQALQTPLRFTRVLHKPLHLQIKVLHISVLLSGLKMVV